MNVSAVKLAFGAVVRAHRTDKGLSQEVLAESAGLHRTYVSLIERGIRNPTLTSIIALAIALDVRPEGLVKAAVPPGLKRGGKKSRTSRANPVKTK